MLQLKLKDRLFLKVLEAILDLVDVASVHCSSTGLELQAMDTEEVAVVKLIFLAEDFENYHCDEEIFIGIPIDAMVKAFRCSDEDDIITIKVGDKVSETITLSFESPKEDNTTAFHFPDVEVTNKRYKITDWQVLVSEYQAFFQMSSAEFTRICNYLSNFGDEVYIDVDDNELSFLATGKDGHVHADYWKTEATATVVTMQEPVSVEVGLKFMNSLAKLSAQFDQVGICLSKRRPLVGECKIGQTGRYIRYFLSQKCKVEDQTSEEIKEERE